MISVAYALPAPTEAITVTMTYKKRGMSDVIRELKNNRDAYVFLNRERTRIQWDTEN
jgi:hypothetical protein